jgi:hypothetical protein
MTSPAASNHGCRFPPEIISHAVWLYHRLCLSFRDTEDLLAQWRITVSYGAIQQWCRTFGPAYARIHRRQQGRLGDTWYLDELFTSIQGRQQYLCRAVDQDGDVIDILVQPRRDRRRLTFVVDRETRARHVSETIDLGLAFWMVNEKARVLMLEPKLFHVLRKAFEATITFAEHAAFVASRGPRLLLSWSAVLGNAS